MYILNSNERQTLRGNDAGADFYLVNMENNTTVMLSNAIGYRLEEDAEGNKSEVADPSLNQSNLTFTGVTYGDMLKVQKTGVAAIAENDKTFEGIVAAAAKDSVLVNLNDIKAEAPAEQPVDETPAEQPIDEA